MTSKYRGGYDVSGSDSTIYQVAERAGVSISTVSLAINHPDRVKSATLDRIMTVIDDLGFMPKEHAVARARTGVGRIAVIAPFTSYPAYLRRLQGVLAEIGRDGTQVIVYDHEDVAVAESPLLSSIPVKGHVDGIIIMDMPIDAKIRSRLTGRLPAVLIGAVGEGLPGVDIDDFEGGRLAGQHLLDWGHQRVAFVREAQPNLFSNSPTQLRADGLTSVLGESGVVEISIPRDETGGLHAIRRLFEEADRGSMPTAVFATRDVVALRVWRAARDAGLRVPEELSIVGFDDDPTAEAVGLTTIRNPLEETGATALRMLRRRLHGENPEDVRLPVEFVERETAGPVSAGDHIA